MWGRSHLVAMPFRAQGHEGVADSELRQDRKLRAKLLDSALLWVGLGPIVELAVRNALVRAFELAVRDALVRSLEV